MSFVQLFPRPGPDDPYEHPEAGTKWRPVTHTFSVRTGTEKNYSQIDEASRALLMCIPSNYWGGPLNGGIHRATLINSDLRVLQHIFDDLQQLLLVA